MAFTYIAVSNITDAFPGGAHTITHFLLNKIPQIKRLVAKKIPVAIIIDESSMVPIHFWAALANLKFIGVQFYIFGDFNQFKPIFLDDPKRKWSSMDSSDFMHDLCNGCKIEFTKYRRGTDQDHFDFVGSIYPHKTCLEDALKQARAKYRNLDTPQTTLCVTNVHRKTVNSKYNKIEYIKSHQKDGIFIKYNCSSKNKGQSMYIWPGIILQSYKTDAKAKQYNIKNGIFYKIKEITQNDVKFVKINDKEEESDELMHLPINEIPEKLLLCWAYTYHKSQGKTIKGVLELAQTSNKNFTLRHLLVGLGRGPCGKNIHVT